ncbi:SLAM family member 7 isoform X1 [Sus scrofa]|uniref:SLAM family member 7 isoform X1 n=2 Tax=Sus scrofa TaxID=9823 RepID=A0A480IGE3_PIG|nr:SLAM family member 7 isoform X1 [Sus scrofa]
MLASPACFILFLLCQLTGPAACGVLKKLVGAVGGSVTFPLNLSANMIDSIIWVFNTTTFVTIQPKMADKKALIIVTQQRNKERVDFPNESYSLKLSKLKKNDSGAYRVEIYSSTLQNPLSQEYELRVYEYLSKPKVTVGLQNNNNGTCVTNLTCSTEEGEEDVTYSWISLGQANNESYGGSILPISLRREKRDMTFICLARNPISSNSSNPIFAWKLCKGTTGGLATSGIFSILLSFILLCFLALMLIILIIRRERRKASIEEKGGVGTHPEILSCSPPSGETLEYDTIPHLKNTIPEENSLNTLYSTVQIPPKVEKPHSLPELPDTPGPFTYENII